jgi:hypothetical protein
MKKINIIEEIKFWLCVGLIFCVCTAAGIFGWWAFEEMTGYTAGLFEIARTTVVIR